MLQKRKLVNIAVGGLLWPLVGCIGPMERTAEQELRDQLLASHRAYREAVAAGPVIEIQRPASETEQELSEERRKQLDRSSGPVSYQSDALQLGSDLLGETTESGVAMSLLEAVQLAVKNNLEVQFARVLPAVSEAQITEAEAAFDAIYFATGEFQKLDTPQPPSRIEQFGSVQEDQRSFTTGLRKPLTTGGQVELSTRFTRNSRKPSFFSITDPQGSSIRFDPFYETNVSASLTQPLLRNFGSDVNRAQIVLATNARHEAVEDLHRQLLTTIAATEQAYWDLVFARHRLLIQLRLLERTKVDRDRLKQRERFDVSPVRLTEANSFVEIRLADVIQTRQLVRQASDALKRLINSPKLSLAGEQLIIPVETPADLPVTFSLLDAVTTALEHRPEVQRALLEIKDASIRQRVADNQRLPVLNLAATVRYNGVTTEDDEKNLGAAYDSLTDGDFIDYLLTAQFEVPIGNRGPEAVYQQQVLNRRAAVIRYQNAAQLVVQEVKDALRGLVGSYQLIGATRAARRAAADNLRAIEEQEEAGVALTPEFLLDLKLSTQQRLADTEIQEIQALTQYNTAISRFYQAMGTLLERNGILFEDDVLENP